MVNAILISAMKSGSGKTTFTFGLHDYLRRKILWRVPLRQDQITLIQCTIV